MNRYFQTPPVVKNLIIINVLVYMATALLPVGDTIMQYCALSLGTPYFHTYQFITYMFLHANFEHIFFNMFALWMFGRTLEYELGSQRFLTFYMVCGVGAALIQYLTALAFGELPLLLVGASGAVMGLLLGQCIGRWANFINREAFGAETTLPWRMRLWTSATEYIEVHPTFFYESLWNLIGLLLILLVVSKARRFDGENTWFYFLWYGLGRFWIEGLRTDSLYLFNWTFLGQPIRVSQALSLLLAVTAAVMLFYNIKIKKHSRDELLVNQVAAEAAEGTAEADISTAEAGESVPAGQEEPELPQPPETQNGEGGETDGNTH